MAENFREHVCPNCGAPLGIPEKHERFFKCQFCGTILEDQATREEQETGVFKIKISQADISSARAARVPVYTTPPVQTSRQPGRLGCVIGIAVFLLVGGILAASLVPALFAAGTISQVIEEGAVQELIEVDSSGPGGLRLFHYGPGFLLPSDNDTSPDFAGVSSAPESKVYLTYVDFENEPALRWITEMTGEKANNVFNRILADDARLYISYANKIAAYNRTQGTLIWESSLSDEIQHNICQGCFQLFGDSIATLSVDGTLQAWDSTSGSMSWQAKLEATPRQVVDFGGNPGVLDESDGTTGFKVFNLSDGSVKQQIFPACPNEPFPNDPQEVGIYDHVQPVPGDAGAVFFGGFFEPGCAMRWLPGADEPAWMATFDSRIVSNIKPENLLLTTDVLFIGVRNGTYAIDMASGAFRVLIEDEDYEFFPIDARDGVLIVRVERTRGTRQWEVWGLDAVLGNVKWTYVPDAAGYIDSTSVSGVVSATGEWHAGLTSNGLTVVQIFDDSPHIVFQTISPQSGTASSPVTVDLTDGPGSLQIKVLGWRNNAFWLIVSRGGPMVLVIDVATGEKVSFWP